MNPSEILGLANYPTVKQLFEHHIDMQFADLRVMLRLPLPPEMPVGCNFAAATLIMNLLGGASVVLFNDRSPGMPAPTSPHKRGARLRHLIDAHLPHDAAHEPPKPVVADVLYKFARNSLVHVLGLRQPRLEPSISIAKLALDALEIELLERHESRPDFLVDPIVREVT